MLYKGEDNMIEENMQEKVGNSIKEIFSSVKNHLEPSYRKQYNIRRFLSVVFLYFLIIAIMIEGSGNSYFSFRGIMVLIWCIVSGSFGTMLTGVSKVALYIILSVVYFTLEQSVLLFGVSLFKISWFSCRFP